MRNLLVIASLSAVTPMIAGEAPSGCVQGMLPALLEQFLLCPVPTPFPEEIELIDFSLSDVAEEDDESAAAIPARPVEADGEPLATAQAATRASQSAACLVTPAWGTHEAATVFAIPHPALRDGVGHSGDGVGHSLGAQPRTAVLHLDRPVPAARPDALTRRRFV